MSTDANVNVSQIKEIFQHHSDILIATVLQECNNDVNACITRLLTITEENERIASKAKSLTLGTYSGSTQVTDDLPNYSIGHEFSITFNRTPDFGLDINVKSIGERILVNELYKNKLTGLPGLSAQAGVLPGDVLVGIDYEYFNVGCALSDVTRITRAVDNTISLQFFRFDDNSWIMDALAAARQGETLADINNEQESRRINERSKRKVIHGDVAYHTYSCDMNNYRDLFSFRRHLLQETGVNKAHPCASLLLDQELLNKNDIEAFTETLSRLLARCLTWETGSICERTRISDILLTMLASGSLITPATVHSSDSNYSSSYNMNSLHFLPRQPNIPFLQSHLPVKLSTSIIHDSTPPGVVNLSGMRTTRPSDRRSSTGTHSSRRSSTGPIQRSMSQMQQEFAFGQTEKIDNPVNASIRLLWKKPLTLRTKHVRPALAIRITSINVVDKSHFEYKIWINDIDSGLEWYVHRRFSEFFQFRETIVAIWPIFARIHFPSRRISISASARVANERLPVLEQFLRSVYAILSVQPLTHLRTGAIYSALQNMLDISFRQEGIEATLQHNRDLFLCRKTLISSSDEHEEDALLAAMSRNASSNSSDSPLIKCDEENVNGLRNASSIPRSHTESFGVEKGSRNDKEDDRVPLVRPDSLRLLMADMASSPLNKPRKNSLFDGDDDEENECYERSERETLNSGFLPPSAPILCKSKSDQTSIATTTSVTTHESEKSHSLVCLRSPSGSSRKRANSGAGSSSGNQNIRSSVIQSDGDAGGFSRSELGDEFDTLKGIRPSLSSSTSDLASHSRVSDAMFNSSSPPTPMYPLSYSLVLSKRLEVFVHWVLQVPTFRHIIDPFVMNFRNKIMEWDLDRSFVLTEELVFERLKYIGEFIDNLQEVLLEGLCTDMDTISTYTLSRHCAAHISTEETPLLSMLPVPTPTTSSVSEQGIDNTKPFYVRSDAHDDPAVNCASSRGRSSSVNEGRVSNVVIPGVDVENLYRRVIRRQVELEVYFPSRDAVSTMMSAQFGRFDIELERKCNILKHKPQSFFGIAVEHMSPSSWEPAVSAFSRVSSVYSIPVDKLDALVVAAKLIPELHEKEHPRTSGGEGKQNSLGADDMLPIFIYCIVMSDIPFANMQSLVHELDNICDPQNRYSEVGYFVTTFQASIQHILNMDEVIGEAHGLAMK